MTRDELLSLPPSIALRVLLDAMSASLPEVLDNISRQEKPKVPRPPKYDLRIRRKNGFQLASETDLEGLRFWLERYRSNASEGGQYAEQDEKRASALSYWVAWREAAPDVPWTGERNDTVVTSAAPTGKPRVYEWPQRRDKPLTPRHAADDSDEQGDIPW